MSDVRAHIEPTSDQLATHYAAVVQGFSTGRLTPVLGAGANLCGRPDLSGEEWLGRHPPSGSELASYLAKRFVFAADGGAPALLEVSQYVSATSGVQTLYDSLHEVFDADFSPTPLHKFLATVQGKLRAGGKLRKPSLIVTTNYDDLLETSLSIQGEPFDLVAYMAEGPHAGRFCHRPHDGELAAIANPRKYMKVDPDERTVILKIHGFVDRAAAADSYVITEDHYISYLTRLDLDRLIPVKVTARMKNCHMLFLGYSLSDWNLRAMLYQLSAEQLSADGHLNRRWWAVLRDPTTTEIESWRRRGVDLFDMPLDDYLAGLSAHLDATLS